VLLHHVVVVEQPLTGGTDIDTSVGGGEPPVGLFEDAAGPIQPGEKRGLPAGASPGRQALTEGDLLGPLGQALGAEQLAANGSGEAVLAGIRAEQGSEEGEGAARTQRNGGNLVVSMVMELLGTV
jgi:hypothetical protein